MTAGGVLLHNESSSAHWTPRVIVTFAKRVSVSPTTEGKVAAAILSEPLDGLFDEPRRAHPAPSRMTKSTGRHSHAGKHAARRHPLERSRHGESHRDQALVAQSHLARTRAATASERDVQAVAGSAAHREGPRIVGLYVNPRRRAAFVR